MDQKSAVKRVAYLLGGWNLDWITATSSLDCFLVLRKCAPAISLDSVCEGRMHSTKKRLIELEDLKLVHYPLWWPAHFTSLDIFNQLGHWALVRERRASIVFFYSVFAGTCKEEGSGGPWLHCQNVKLVAQFDNLRGYVNVAVLIEHHTVWPILSTTQIQCSRL